MSEQAIKYEQLVQSYENRLLNQLRSHGVDLDFLEIWVPDEDPVSSILNMAEAAGIGCPEFHSTGESRHIAPHQNRRSEARTHSDIRC